MKLYPKMGWFMGALSLHGSNVNKFHRFMAITNMVYAVHAPSANLEPAGENCSFPSILHLFESFIHLHQLCSASCLI